MSIDLHLQETDSAKTPPRMGPIPPARAHMNSMSPMNKVRNLMEKRSEMVMIVTWIKAPPAIPWRARPAIKTPILGAVAHMIELTKNHATDTKRIGFLPQMSDSLALIMVRNDTTDKY